VFPNDPLDAHSAVSDLARSIALAIETGTSQSMPVQRYPIEMHQDGKSWFEDMYWSATNTPIYDADGTLLCVSHTTIDITEKVMSVQRLSDSEGRLSAYVSATSDVFYRMSPDWAYMHQLDGREFLKTTEEWGEYRIEEYVYPDDLDLARKAIRAAIDSKSPFELEHRVVRADGTLGWTYSRAIPRLDPDGEIYEWIGAASDITIRKLAEEKLKELDRRKDEFLAMLAHELRNPLAPIGAAAELLQRGALGESTIRKTAQVIGRQVRHMTGLVDDLLDVSRVTRGLVELDDVRLDIRAVANDAVEQVHPLILSRRHELALRLPAQPAWVTGDRKRLVQVLSNLLNNAGKYTPDGGAIELNVAIQAAWVQIEVIDNGIGMTAELISRAFDLFSQTERTPDRTSGGLGIGLALVKSLVDLHHGRVLCESAGLGKGSKFTLCLPRLTEDKVYDPVQEAASIALDAPSMGVMVIDDNVDAANMLGMLLEASGFQVSVAYDAQSALAQAEDNPPRAFLVDIGLPDIDGIELARRLRERPATAAAMVIAVTGYGQDQDRQRTAAAGFDHHLVKPVDVATLEKILSQNSS